MKRALFQETENGNRPSACRNQYYIDKTVNTLNIIP